MKRQTYQQPLIEQTEVLVEAGIAVSTIMIETYNQIMDMEDGGNTWGVYSE